ncbi:biotin synthase [Brockia lithotrophica]|uniref:Biotin synthase n=1 Tax=Brockia lithotrophica TaxID=933949 RepID=A0A660L6L7_9BACL|nr:biotin synthase [Brockia lithotrophica]
MDWVDKARRILAGESLTPEEGLRILAVRDWAELLPVLAGAHLLRRAAFGEEVGFATLINAKSGLCPEDCAYCSQSSRSRATIPRYPLLAEEDIVRGAERAVALGARVYCVVTSGRAPTMGELERLAEAVRRIKAKSPALRVYGSFGLLDREGARILRESGLDGYNHNLNTSRRMYPRIATTHTYDDRLKTLRVVREAGMRVISGAIFGMGEEDSDVLALAEDLARAEVDEVPVNFLIPIPGTPLGHRLPLSPLRALVVLTFLRYRFPRTPLRVAGGRELSLRTLQPLALLVATSIFVGDYLTTPGQAPSEDVRLLRDLGWPVPASDRPEGSKEGLFLSP